MRKYTTAAAVALALTLGVPALAAAKGSPDQDFVIKAAQGGIGEVELGGVAARVGGADSKKFGQRMVKDHNDANKQLMALAKKLGITLPKTPDAKMQAEIKKLEKLKGANFDQAYLPTMKKDHEQDVKDFRNEAKNGKDPQVRAFAAKVLPTLESHLQMASAMVAHHPYPGGGAGH